jgi:galactosyl transferase GMA12/MNN10 family
LPPAEFSDANALVTNDANGLNNGVFFIRVSAWAIEVMSANVAYRTFNPHEQLTFQDQSALDNIFHMDKFRDQVVYCPQRWFNAYQSGLLNETIEANQVRRGDLVVHFAGVGNKLERMNYWCDIAEKHLPDWEVGVVYTSYLEEIEEFWSQKRDNDAIEKEELKRARLSANILIGETERNMTMYREYLTVEEQFKIDESLRRIREQVEKQNKVLIWGANQDLREVRHWPRDLGINLLTTPGKQKIGRAREANQETNHQRRPCDDNRGRKDRGQRRPAEGDARGSQQLGRHPEGDERSEGQSRSRSDESASESRYQARHEPGAQSNDQPEHRNIEYARSGGVEPHSQ